MENTEQLICEALVREIRDAKRWSAIEEAWNALLVVRRMAKSLKAENTMTQAEYEGWRNSGGKE